MKKYFSNSTVIAKRQQAMKPPPTLAELSRRTDLQPSTLRRCMKNDVRIRRSTAVALIEFFGEDAVKVVEGYRTPSGLRPASWRLNRMPRF